VPTPVAPAPVAAPVDSSWDAYEQTIAMLERVVGAPGRESPQQQGPGAVRVWLVLLWCC
jgi:hypothetical protein